MIVRVKCFTGMRPFAPAGASGFEVELEAGARVRQLLDHLRVPDEVRPMIAINGRKTEPAATLEDGDSVVLFTPMEGG